MIELGAFADDFTGATDLATNWRSRGLRVSVLLDSDVDVASLSDVDAAVIALKSRTAPVTTAINDSLKAVRILKEAGAKQVYDKYCSTFDSTRHGNIGPILDAVSEELAAERTVVVPSFPDAGRTVYSRQLFVNGELLANSPMKDHPLTPMRKSDVVDLLAEQSTRPVSAVSWQDVQDGPARLRFLLDSVPSHHHVVVDAVTNRDLSIIAEATQHDRLVSGGSGLALGAAQRQTRQFARLEPIAGRRLVLAGSASSTTRRQVAHGRAHLPATQIDTKALTSDLEGEAQRLCSWVSDRWREEASVAPLIYATDELTNASESADASELIEHAFALIAVELVKVGLRQLIVAGGETSGSVMQGLQVKRLDLMTPVAPGLSWARGVSHAHENTSLDLLLKSGNFGQTELFTDAWRHVN